MLISRVARRSLTSLLSKSKDLNKNLTFKVGQFPTTILISTQSLFTYTNSFDQKTRELQEKTKEKERVKTEVFENFESDGLRSVFNEEILTAVSISSSNEDLEKCGALIGLYKTLNQFL